MELQNSKYNSLIDNVGKLLVESKLKLASQINTVLVTVKEETQLESKISIQYVINTNFIANQKHEYKKAYSNE